MIVIERLECTAQDPFSFARDMVGAKWQHPDAEHVRDSDDGFALYVCPNCGMKFEVELPL